MNAPYSSLDVPERLQELRSLPLVGGAPHPVLDDFVQLCASAFEVPMALITLVDDRKQIYLARVGIGPSLLDGATSLCAQAVDPLSHVFVIDDLEEHTGLKDHPAVAGGPRVRFCAGAPLVLGDGSVVGALCVLDIRPREFSRSNRETMERLADQLMRSFEMRRDLDELGAANERLEDFVKTVSHDLRQPLRGIGLLAEYIDEDAGEFLPDEARDHLAKMQRRVHRLTDIVEGLQRHARAGVVSGTLELVDLHALAFAAHEVIGTPAGLRLRITGDPITLITERAPLELVIRNLMGNAVKHHDRDTGVIDFTAYEGNERVVITVADDGPGIPAASRERVFEPFHRLKSRDEVEGSGLGLAIVRRTVRTRGGTIAIEDAGPRGTSVRFTWPMSGLQPEPRG